MSEGIAYQNKDIEFKLISETFKEKSFEAYGLKLPKIKEVLPTNLPAVSANEKHMDNLFLLEDGTFAIVDYEAEYKFSNYIKYANYISRVMEKYYNENNEVPDIRLIVIYTGDVERAKATFQIKCMTIQTEPVFLRHLPAEEIYQTIQQKVKRGEKLTEQIFVLSGLLVISDKFINRKNVGVIRRKLGMTKVGRMLYEDGMKEGKRETAEKLLRRGSDIETIMDITDLTEEEVKEVEKIC